MFLRESLKSEVPDRLGVNCGLSSPAISESLDYDSETQYLRYVPKAQFQAVGTYGYVRLKEDNGQNYYLYRELFRLPDLLESLVIHHTWEDLIRLLLNGGSLDSILTA
jgi:hypothetical protein